MMRMVITSPCETSFTMVALCQFDISSLVDHDNLKILLHRYKRDPYSRESDLTASSEALELYLYLDIKTLANKSESSSIDVVRDMFQGVSDVVKGKKRHACYWTLGTKIGDGGIKLARLG